MNGLHGIIFTYERRGNLQELGSIRSSASIPFGGTSYRFYAPLPWGLFSA